METNIHEIWKPIKGYEGLYEISNLGSLKGLDKKDSLGRCVKGRIMTAGQNNSGYNCCSLSKLSKNLSTSIHRLVAEAFIPNPLNKPQVNHINGIRTDNRVENLEWCTQSENNRHAVKIGSFKIGEKHPGSKLKESDIMQIRTDNRTQKKIAEQYNISQSQVWRIKRHKRWSHV